MHECPNCASRETQRIRRRFWMRFVPKMIHVHCRACGQRSATIVSTLHTRSLGL